MEIKEIKSRDIWDKFHEENPTHSFLQSWNWGEFNEAMGHRVFRLGVFDGGELNGTALVIKIAARRGSFLFVPHGPVFENSKFEIRNSEILISYLKNIARAELCSFIRISPILQNTAENKKLFKKIGFRKAPIHMHAELMWLLDISKSEQELLRGMRKTTRYSINKAETDGVTIEKSEKMTDVEKFNEIYQATVNRQHFAPFSSDYLKKEFEAFSKDGKISLFFAKYQGEIVSAAMITYEKNEAFYHQGASNHKFPKITPSQLLQWEIIKDVKKRGCKVYNFWGISPDDKPNHPWHGLSLFKKGFGGNALELLPAQDLIISPKYWLNFVVEKIRKIKRGL